MYFLRRAKLMYAYTSGIESTATPAAIAHSAQQKDNVIDAAIKATQMMTKKRVKTESMLQY